MHLPGTPSLFFLAILLLFLPWAAYRSAQRVRAAMAKPGTLPLPPREQVWLAVIYMQAGLLLLAWLVGRGFGYRIFALPNLSLSKVLVPTVITLVLCLGLRLLSRVIHSEAERRRLVVYQLAPRTTREWLLWIGTVLVAGVAEEAAYRGVGMSILWYAFGNPWLAVLICAVAFALAHSMQGWKSSMVIFGIALVLHALVAITNTLIFAMAAHITYNLIAGARISSEAEKFDREGMAQADLPSGEKIPELP